MKSFSTVAVAGPKVAQVVWGSTGSVMDAGMGIGRQNRFPYSHVRAYKGWLSMFARNIDEFPLGK
jgi:hypothetical protein